MLDVELCRKLAGSFHRTTRMDYEELFQEACLVWVKSVEGSPKYDPRKASLKTFATWAIYSHFLTIAAKNKKQPKTVEIDLEMACSSVSAEQVVDWQDRMRSLSDEAQFVVKMIFETPCEFLSIGSSTGVRKRIIRVLVEQHGISEKAAKDAVLEIRNLLAV